MSKVRECIDAEIESWISQQHLFFVSTAPLSEEGHINCSPKGGDAFRVLGPLEVAYLDYTGSGAETAAHLRENGRITVMFCAFNGKPNILRLYGTGEVIAAGHPRFEELVALFPANPGTRAVTLIQVTRVYTSCGYAVPIYEFQAERDLLDKWATVQGERRLTEYRLQNNSFSIDHLPAFQAPADDGSK
ncbi:hypothetical protein LBMAG21_14560 [Armatimonadota bacterium]|nr:hypothetical protein LBMAG21_14560 [Armatimonadota bacterium]